MSDLPDMLLRRVEAQIRRRPSTDRNMGYGWMIIPVLPPLVIIVVLAAAVGLVVSSITSIQQIGTAFSGAAAAIVILYVLTIFAFYAVLLLGALAFYYLIDRRNRHFKRQQLLFSAIPSYMLTSATSTHEQIARLVESSEDSAFEETERPAGLWAVASLFAAPIVVLIVAYNLTQDLRKHEERQLAYWQTLPFAFEEAGFARPSLASSRAHNRDPMLYVVLTAITAGIFWIYWFYTLLKDYNEHFSDQAVFEDRILGALKPMIACVACHASIPQSAKFCPLCGASQQPNKQTPPGT